MKSIRVIATIGFLLLALTGQALAAPEQAVVILTDEARTLAQVNTLQDEINKSCRVTSYLPPLTFLVSISQEKAAYLRTKPYVDEVSFQPLEALDTDSANTRSAIQIWNRIFWARGEARTNVTEPTDVPQEESSPSTRTFTKEEQGLINAEYTTHWQEDGDTIQEKLLTNAGLVYEPPATSGSTASGEVASNSVGSVSLYMTGKIAVSVFFTNYCSFISACDPPFPDRTEEDINASYATLVEEMSRFAVDEPNAGIEFTFVQDVHDESIFDVPLAASDPSTYANDLRNTFETDWAFVIRVWNGTGHPGAGDNEYNLFGTHIRPGGAARHETGHVWGAPDQYAHDYRNRYGYLGISNINAQAYGGDGFFFGHGEGQSDLMIGGSSSPIGVYTRGQFGWNDLDGDGIFDVRDTFAETEIDCRHSTLDPSQISCAGTSTDKPLLMEFPFTEDITLNTVEKIEYRLNGMAWVDQLATGSGSLADASSGAEDSAKDFFMTTPCLPNGTYTIEARAINSVGNVGPTSAKTNVTITASSVNDAAPFANFTVTPEQGSIFSSFLFDASPSRDLEDGPALLYRWDFGDDGWDTGWSSEPTVTNSFPDPGEQKIRLEVQDQSLQVSSLLKRITVSDADELPHAFFTATPITPQGHPEPIFEVLLDGSASKDAETKTEDLLLRWDFEGDGLWDTELLPINENSIITHRYSLDMGPQPMSAVRLDYARKVAIDPAQPDFAYVAGFKELYVIDVRNPADPLNVATIPIKGNARAVAAAGGFVYLGVTGDIPDDDGIHIFNVANPQTPVLVASHRGSLSLVQDIFIADGYAYVADYFNDLQIVDVSDPFNPSSVGGILTSGEGNAVFVTQPYVYLAAGSAGLMIFDVSVPESPTLVGSYATPGNALGIAVSGNYAYVGDGIEGLHVVDITNPASPQLVATVPPLGASSEVSLSGNFVLIQATKSGIQIVDVSDPLDPKHAGSQITPYYTSGVLAFGGYAYAAAAKAGLWIFDLTSEFTVSAKTEMWKPVLEVTDSAGQSNQTSRAVHTVTYNHPPKINDFTIEPVDAPKLLPIDNVLITAMGKIFIHNDIAFISGGGQGVHRIDLIHPQGLTAGLGLDIPTPGIAYDVVVDNVFAYVADGSSGLSIIDVSSAKTAVVANFAMSGTAEGVFVTADYVFVANGMGLWVKPKSPLDNSTPSIADSFGYSIDVYVNGNYAYVLNSGNSASTSTGFEIFQVTPQAEGSPSLTPVGTYLSPGIAKDIYVSENYAYVADYTDGLQIIDVADPSNPALVGNYNTPGYTQAVHVVGNYAYLGVSGAGPVIVDVTDPTNPTFFADYFFDSNVLCTIKDIRLHENNVYITDTCEGFRSFSLEITPALNLELTSFNDPDFGTTWDGLQLRWDVGSDGIWETPFLGSESASIWVTPSMDTTSVTAELRDHFNTRASMTKVALPASPSHLEAAIIGPGQVHVTWRDHSTNEDKFILGRSLSPQLPGSFSVELDSDVTSYVDENVPGDWQFHYSIQAANAAGASDWISSEIVDMNEPPTISISDPPAETYDHYPEFYAVVTDNVALASYVLKLDAQIVDSGPLQGMSDTVYYKPTASLASGKSYVYTLETTDRAGNPAEASKSVYIKNSITESTGCFLGGTPILMADGSYKNIEDVGVGELVRSYDFEEKAFVPAPVLQTYIHPSNPGGYLEINSIKVTPNHPLFINGDWLAAGEAKVGDMLFGEEGEATPITSIKQFEGSYTVYNFEIEETHVYYTKDMLSHNRVALPSSK